jgi:hypothetical protein
MTLHRLFTMLSLRLHMLSYRLRAQATRKMQGRPP